MIRCASALVLSVVLAASAAEAESPATTSSLARNYYTSHETDASASGDMATSAVLPLSSASADYGHLTAETTGIPLEGGVGRGAYAGAFGQSSVGDLLFFDFGAAGRPAGDLRISVDFTVKGGRPVLEIPPLPANVGWMNAAALWGVSLRNDTISGQDRIYRLHGCCGGETSFVSSGSHTLYEPITGDFNLTVPFLPGGGRVGQLPFSYDLFCGVDNQEIVVAGAQADCLGWSLDITGVHLLNAAGQVVSDVVISAASTYDYNGSGQPIFPPSNVPEPLAWMLIVVGFFGLGATLRRARLAC